MPPRSTKAPKLTRRWTPRPADLARLEVGEEAPRAAPSASPRGRRRRDSTTLLRFLSSSMILASSVLPTYGARSRTRRSSTSDAGRKPRRPMSMMRPPLTTSMTGPVDDAVGSLIFSIVPHARSYCARFLDRIRRPSLSSFCEDQGLDLLADRHDLGRVDVVADAQLAAGMTPSDL
jgi:hypothetical protein